MPTPMRKKEGKGLCEVCKPYRRTNAGWYTARCLKPNFIHQTLIWTRLKKETTFIDQ